VDGWLEEQTARMCLADEVANGTGVRGFRVAESEHLQFFFGCQTEQFSVVFMSRSVFCTYLFVVTFWVGLRHCLAIVEKSMSMHAPKDVYTRSLH
jgi:hypothetical protein